GSRKPELWRATEERLRGCDGRSGDREDIARAMSAGLTEPQPNCVCLCVQSAVVGAGFPALHVDGSASADHGTNKERDAGAFEQLSDRPVPSRHHGGTGGGRSAIAELGIVGGSAAADKFGDFAAETSANRSGGAARARPQTRFA